MFLFYFPAESFIELLRTDPFYKGSKDNVPLAFLKSDHNVISKNRSRIMYMYLKKIKYC